MADREAGGEVERLIHYLKDVARQHRTVTYVQASQDLGIYPVPRLFGLLGRVQARQGEIGCDLSALVVRADGKPGAKWGDLATWPVKRDECYRVLASGAASARSVSPATPARPTPEAASQADGLVRRIRALATQMPDYARDLDVAHHQLQRDPNAAGIALRRGLERLLASLCGRKGADLNEAIQSARGRCPDRVISHMHTVRSLGNVAAHDVTHTDDVEVALRSALIIGEWAADQKSRGR